MPGLLRAAAATAVVAGTAQATRNAVNRHSAEKDAKAYTNAMNTAQAQAAPPPQQYAPPPQAYAPPPPQQVAPPPSSEDVVSQLERLGALKAQGLLTDEEFNAQKAKLLGM
jgi:ribonuclease D